MKFMEKKERTEYCIYPVRSVSFIQQEETGKLSLAGHPGTANDCRKDQDEIQPRNESSVEE